MRVVVIGTGHVGLVTCGTLAALGHDVVGTDADQEKTSMLQRGILPFHEPGLDALIEKHAREGDPAQTIIDVADEQNADLIVVGARGTTGLRRFMLGSVAAKLSHHAPSSLLIVRDD